MCACAHMRVGACVCTCVHVCMREHVCVCMCMCAHMRVRLLDSQGERTSMGIRSTLLLTSQSQVFGASFAVGSREVSSCCLSLATAVLGRSQVDGRGWGWKGDLTSLLFYEKRPSVVPYELSDLIRGPGTLGCLSDNFSSQKSG